MENSFLEFNSPPAYTTANPLQGNSKLLFYDFPPMNPLDLIYYEG